MVKKKDDQRRTRRDVERIRDRNARRSLQRIRRARRRAPERLQPLLAEMERSLFDPDLDIQELKRRCGVRDNSVPIRFSAAVGRPPAAYLEDRRMEVACRLLADTDLKVWEIAHSIGFSSLQVFSRAFHRWAKERPTTFRAREQGRARNSPRSGGQPDDLLTLRRALLGDAQPREVKRLFRRLAELYPETAESIR